MQLATAYAEGPIKLIATPSEVEFGVMGAKPNSPAPTLFIFASDIENTLPADTYNKIGKTVGKHGFICVSLNLPKHPGEELEGWARATQAGEAWVPTFTSRVSQVLDYLIAEHYTDARKVAVAGTSRGGFMAMHIAAADARFKCAIGFVPVTDLAQLKEFAAIREDKFVKQLELAHLADRLVGRPIWIGIGNNDDRVNTDKAIDFTRTIVRASSERSKQTPENIIDVELHVMPWPGHGGEAVKDGHDIAAAWLLARCSGDNKGNSTNPYSSPK
jgi:dienelactone hydrolase